jgi:hypothetical protein
MLESYRSCGDKDRNIYPEREALSVGQSEARNNIMILNIAKKYSATPNKVILSSIHVGRNTMIRRFQE